MNSLFRAIQASSHAMRGILTSYMIFFQPLIPTLLYSPFFLIQLLFPNYNFVSILMTVFKCHCHQGSQEKLISIYCSFLKNSLGGALSFVCHYVNHILILHLWDFIYKKSSAAIKGVNEVLCLLHWHGTGNTKWRPNGSDCSMRAAHLVKYPTRTSFQHLVTFIIFTPIKLRFSYNSD